MTVSRCFATGSGLLFQRGPTGTIEENIVLQGGEEPWF